MQWLISQNQPRKHSQERKQSSFSEINRKFKKLQQKLKRLIFSCWGTSPLSLSTHSQRAIQKLYANESLHTLHSHINSLI